VAVMGRQRDEAVDLLRWESEMVRFLVVQLAALGDALLLAEMTDLDADWAVYGEFDESVTALRLFLTVEGDLWW
jgi:hypothetical protein